MFANLTFAQRENFVKKCSNEGRAYTVNEIIKEYKDLYKDYERLYSENRDKNPNKTKKDTIIKIKECSYEEILNSDSDTASINRNIIIANFLVRECENYKNRKDLQNFEGAFDRFAEILESIDNAKESGNYPPYIEKACKNFYEQYNNLVKYYNKHSFE